MIRKVPFARPLLLLFISILAVSSSHPQKQRPTHTTIQAIADQDVVRVDTTLVTVPVSVMDRQGRFIPNLSQHQFHLHEGGIEQELAYFENAGKPFTVALVLDTSDSTRFKLHDIQRAAIAFVDQLRSEDRVLIAAFDKGYGILNKPTGDRRVLHDAILSTRPGGGTSLYNALDFIMAEGLRGIQGRKALVLFTDGVDTTSSTATYLSTLHTAEELDALIYAIQYNTYDTVAKDGMPQGFGQSPMVSAGVRTANNERLDAAYARANRFLRLISDKTGGRHFSAATLGHLSSVFTQIAQELRQQYSIGYYPKIQHPSGETRRIKVVVDVDKAVVRARRSYVSRPIAGAKQ